ncbi:methyl-accepting chemotaxis protein [Marinobacter halophilus]|uniref:Methyl-accepting chemotaxis protein n=1 Tax=Marinobacter halophilus TaxID=1323740 RepID=A0A2T1KB17_9GAMM|nr:methyl-accepting chemotaxis protein [Marinobacter halophilus]PSF07341.1 methyl-accepting chemotaxis protein [Marinobacter halophilus]GGC81857.1 methyl-accepting chemotaxis protein [Marinobacter halophilus]
MKQLSLRFKLYGLVITLLLLMGVSIVITAQLSLGSMEERLSHETRATVQTIVMDQLIATAGQYGELVTGQFETAYQTPEVVRSVITRNIEADSSGRISRRDLQETVGTILAEQEHLSSIYAQFEPDAYDGQDIYFTDGLDEHSSDQGTLEIYYYRDPQGNVQFSRTEDPSAKYLDNRNEFGIREAEWYLCSRDSLKPCLMEPYEYEIEEGYSELMTSLVVPILDNGRFAGVAGVDINLSTLQATITQVSQALFDGESRVSLLSEGGLIAASSHYQEHLGRPLQDALPDLAAGFVRLHQQGGRFDNGKTLAVAYPVRVALPGSEWSLLIELPREVALAGVEEITGLLSSEVADTAARQTLVGVVVVLMAIAVLVLLVRSVTRPLDEIRDRMRSLASAEGDLTRELEIDTHAELIDLAGGFNAFLARLREMIDDLKGVNAQVRGQAADVGAIARDTDDQTSRQHQDIDSVVTAMNEMSAAAGEVAGFAGEAAENARAARDGIRFTQDTLKSALRGVDALAGDMGQASSAIGHVAQRSEEINRIIEVIRGIAEQTNLLALNAAIEAARAGEQGRGFAVVADEVRNLASKTRESTDEISAMIERLKGDVSGAVTVIQSGVDRATSAVDGTREADHSLATVVERIGTIVEHVTQVATAAEEQSSVSEEINRNLTQIGDAATDLRELAQRVRQSGDALDGQVQVLDRELGRLKT